MTKTLIFTGPLLVAVAISAGCSRQPTVPPAQFGDAVRNVMEAQIHDYEAALHPTPDAVEGSDPERLNNVVEVYREDLTEPQSVSQPISISFGSQ
ncbi:MAG: hypothetical protein OEM25_01305 [Gammaproteobacteria bacterium]|nr:hypothetical protein [Gammaproteobacteria bacterium]